MKVRVYSLVPFEAELSGEQVCAYMARTGWRLVRLQSDMGNRSAHWVRDGHGRGYLTFFNPVTERQLADAATRIAEVEGRQPGEVLAAMANGHHDGSFNT